MNANRTHLTELIADESNRAESDPSTLLPPGTGESQDDALFREEHDRRLYGVALHYFFSDFAPSPPATEGDQTGLD